MKIALLSNITIDMLAENLRKKLACEIYTSPGFDTWQQELLSQDSGLYAFKADALVIILHANSYADSWENIASGKNLIDDWLQAVKVFAANSGSVPVFVSSIDVSDTWNSRAIYASQKRLGAYFENYFLEKLYSLENIYVLPLKDILENIARVNYYSSKIWYLGSMPYSLKALSEISDLIARYVCGLHGARKKCLAVDLDNTLWGGVIGEDGVNGIKLANSKEGAIYQDAQRVLKKMQNQGVMLAILSKNNVSDVDAAFSHADMILKREDFVAEFINWQPKSQNIKQLAKVLNIALDAFVFLDDNPAEREQMKAQCPEVSVVDFPSDISKLPDIISKVYDEYFFTLNVTSEDAHKTQMYRAESKRREIFSQASSVNDFLKKLDMKIDVHVMQPSEELRVTQLVNKTNQFNLTSRRYTQDEIHAFANNPDSEIITAHVSDKYGDQGLISVMILEYSGENALINTFLMSCRVMGRQVECEIMSELRKFLIAKKIEKQRNISRIMGEYIKTAKNSPVENFYDTMKFRLVNQDHDQDQDQARKFYEIGISDLPETTGLFGRLSE